MAYYNMNVHTAYDLLNSSISLDNLYKKLLLDNQKAVIISDPNMYAAIKNHKLARKNKIKLIHALNVKVDYELNFLDISILAKNEKMFYKLLDISSDVQTRETNIYLENLLKQISDFKNDTILLINNNFRSVSTMISLSEDLKDYVHYFAYTEATDYNVYSNISNVVYSSPSYYLDSKDYRTRLVARAIRDNKKLNIEDLHVETGDNYIKTQADFEGILKNTVDSAEKNFLIKAFSNQKEIIDECSYNLEFSAYKLPKYVYSEEEEVFKKHSAYDYLKYLTIQGLKEKGKFEDKVYIRRLKYELSVIKDMGFEDYFLIVQDFVKYAKNQGILVGDGRGSAAGSLVCYLLGITQADPIVYNLLFERFLNKDRISMPDIDIDFQDTRRDEVIKYVEDKYGSDRVAQIITFGTLQAKAAARETARIFNFPEEKLKFISKNLSSRKTLDQSYEESKALREFVENSKQNKVWFNIARSLEGLPKNKSVHAAGIVISGDGLMKDYIALEKSNLTKHLSQWTMDDLEYIGLLKIDFLAIRYLTMLKNIEEDIKNENKNFSIDTISYDDPNVYKLFAAGDTDGIFQFENAGLRKFLRILKPTEFKDIYAMTSLYRPGPMEFISEYIDRKHGKKQVVYLHPSLEGILKETYGIIVYQEQIMQIAVKFAGMTLNEADNMRRAVSKKDEIKLIEYGNIFVRKSIECGQDEKIARKLYDQIVTFARYGFNKSHAVVYSMLAYKLAYMKCYHKKYFMTELLNNVISDPIKINEYKTELTKNKIKLLNPDVNKSQINFSVIKDDISFALVAIKNVGYKTAENIVFERERFGKYLDIDDFLRRLDKKVDYQAALSLAKAGGLDTFKHNRASLLNKIKSYYEDTRDNINDIRFAISSLSGLTLKVEELEEFSIIERINMEKEVTGTYFLKHPVLTKREEYPYLPLKNISNESLDAYVEIVSFDEKNDAKGNPMAFLVVNDGLSNYNVKVFSSVYPYVKSILKNNSYVVINLKHQIYKDEDSYILEKAMEFDSYKEFCLQNVKQISVLVTDENKKFLQSVTLPNGKGNLYLFSQNSLKDKKVYSLENEQEFVRNYLDNFDKNTIRISYRTV